MKFIKNPDLNPKSVTDNSVTVNADKQVILGTTESVTVPKGTTAERPSTPVEGMLRYNTDDSEFKKLVKKRIRETRKKLNLTK